MEGRAPLFIYGLVLADDIHCSETPRGTDGGDWYREFILGGLAYRRGIWLGLSPSLSSKDGLLLLFRLEV